MKTTLSLLAASSIAIFASAPTAQAQEVKLGVVMSNTGTYAFVGTPVINAIRMAFDKEEDAWVANQLRREVLARVATLTPEERHVAELVVQGRPNKAIALETGLAVRTIEKRRHDVLAKMKAESIAELVRLFMSLPKS